MNARALGAAVMLVLLAVPASASPAVDPRTRNNVCKLSSKDLGDGTQNPNGSCVETFMGEIPSKQQMVSAIIRFPQNNATLVANQPFTIRTKTINLITGFFDDPVNEYYIFPQTLDDNGFIQGHSHVTIQRIVDADEPLNPEVFAFFAGLNEPANGNGELTTTVQQGLPAGHYRLCTLVSSFAHQPVAMPVAQRGAQDDCVRFTVLGPPPESGTR